MLAFAPFSVPAESPPFAGLGGIRVLQLMLYAPEPIAETPGTKQVQQPNAEIVISRSNYPEAAKHIDEAQAAGKPSEGIVDRASANARRKDAMKGVKTKPRADRNEYPPAVLKTNAKASVKHIPLGDNRGAGASMGHQLKNVPDGTKVTVKTGP